MTRRYTQVETMPVVDLLPGDEMVLRRRVISVARSLTTAGETVHVTWDDGIVETFDLAADPALEIVARKKADR